jgi:hypothetical protein
MIALNKELNRYVDQKNRFNFVFNGRAYDLTSSADRQLVAIALDFDLSPEILTCDGELPRAQVRTRAAFLQKAASQLVKLDPTVRYRLNEYA